jgi:hypothetical protein
MLKARGDDGFLHQFSEVGFGIVLDLLKKKGRQLFRREIVVALSPAGPCGA